jgi:hypothetical protein
VNGVRTAILPAVRQFAVQLDELFAVPAGVVIEILP